MKLAKTTCEDLLPKNLNDVLALTFWESKTHTLVFR